jgi:hypothetical protein
MMSNSFAGIAPENALGFVLSEISGLIVVAVVYKGFNWRQ